MAMATILFVVPAKAALGGAMRAVLRPVPTGRCVVAIAQSR